MTRALRLAAIDIGTVTTRLLVADVSEDAVVEVARSTDITNLGEGLTASGRLADAAIARVCEVIAGYVATIAELDVVRTVALATSASRDADNGEELVAALSALGVELQIIGGEREARLSFLGATWSFSGEGILVVDVGGGSTELIFGSAQRESSGALRADIDAMRSIDVGSRRITEMFLHADPPAPAELEAARAYVADELRPFFDALRSKPRALVSLAGAATSLSAINLGLVAYNPDVVHLSCLTGPQLADLVATLAALPLIKRREVPGLHPGRAPVIVGGALVLEAVVALAGLDSTNVSEHDILYGILLDTYRELHRGAEGQLGDGGSVSAGA